jgi:hypothetical protein
MGQNQMICRIYIGKSLTLKCWLLFSFVWGNDLMYHVMYGESSTKLLLKHESRYMSKLLTNKLYLK